jgi:adenylosuccinate lyase
MESRSIFSNLSPLDHRYYLANREIFEQLESHMSEDAVLKYCLAAESSLLKSHIDYFFGGNETLKTAVEEASEKITPEEIYREEEKTQHNIRALVNVFQRFLPEKLKPYIHLGATSVDILDTAAAMRIRDAVRKVVLPLLLRIEALLCDIAETYADTPQIGRTHGQHAVPVTVGFAFSEYVARLGKGIEELEARSKELRGKLAGAVGAYNATSLLIDDPEALEKKYLSYLGLKPSEHATQIVEPEYLLRLLLEMNVIFGILANLADDLRNLQRSEIGEVSEHFSSSQVGSSTMPQKRNPWNSEHVKSLWKAFAPRVMTFYLDQISEHQRDLTNSASSRFVADYLGGFCAAAERMRRILGSLYVDVEKCRENLGMRGDMVLAEAAYIVIAAGGEPEGHEKVRRATLQAQQSGESLVSMLKKDPSLWREISKRLEAFTGTGAEEFFAHPELYRGKSAEKARHLAQKYKNIISKIEDDLP